MLESGADRALDWLETQIDFDAALPVSHGKSGDRVWTLEQAGRGIAYLKAFGRADPGIGEAARHAWLAGHRLAPTVLGFRAWPDGAALLTAAAPGRALHAWPNSGEPATIAAASLRTLHALDVSRCPFDWRIPERLQAARANVLEGRVDETDFDEDRLGMRADAVLALVERDAPADDDLVVCHGDACLPNIVVDGERAQFVDCGRLGVGSRALDIALCARSLADNFGAAEAAAFLDAYGADPRTRARLSWERLIDELF